MEVELSTPHLTVKSILPPFLVDNNPMKMGKGRERASRVIEATREKEGKSEHEKRSMIKMNDGLNLTFVDSFSVVVPRENNKKIFKNRTFPVLSVLLT